MFMLLLCLSLAFIGWSSFTLQAEPSWYTAGNLPPVVWCFSQRTFLLTLIPFDSSDVSLLVSRWKSSFMKFIIFHSFVTSSSTFFHSLLLILCLNTFALSAAIWSHPKSQKEPKNAISSNESETKTSNIVYSIFFIFSVRSRNDKESFFIFFLCVKKQQKKFLLQKNEHNNNKLFLCSPCRFSSSPSSC